MSELQVWDSLLSLTLRSDGTLLRDAEGEPAVARQIDLSDAFAIAYDADRRCFTISIGTTVAILTDATHGALGYSTTGELAGPGHHAVAQADPEGHPGFLSLAWANNLVYYTGTSPPASSGEFGTTSVGVRWYTPVVVGGRQVTTRTAARRLESWIIDGVDPVSWAAEDMEVVQVNGSSAPITLPAAADPKMIVLDNIGVDAAAITTTGGDTIEGNASPVAMPAGECWILIGPNQNNWRRFKSS